LCLLPGVMGRLGPARDSPHSTFAASEREFPIRCLQSPTANIPLSVALADEGSDAADDDER
jgi:hypothetical protein